MTPKTKHNTRSARTTDEASLFLHSTKQSLIVFEINGHKLPAIYLFVVLAKVLRNQFDLKRELTIFEIGEKSATGLKSLLASCWKL